MLTFNLVVLLNVVQLEYYSNMIIDNRSAISGTRPKTENFKELGRSTLSHYLPPISSSHSPLQSALLYRFFYHMHLLAPPLTSAPASNLTKLYLIIVKNFRQRQVATCL